MIQQLRGDISLLLLLDHFQEAIQPSLQALQLIVQLLTLQSLPQEVHVQVVQGHPFFIWQTQTLLIQQHISLLSIHLMVDQVGQH